MGKTLSVSIQCGRVAVIRREAREKVIGGERIVTTRLSQDGCESVSHGSSCLVKEPDAARP